MILPKKFKVLSMLLVSVIFSASTALSISLGDKAPEFKVVSGSGEELDLGMLSGKTAVMFYETKDTKEKNRMLKNELNAFYDSLSTGAKGKIARIAIIRCSSFMPNIWRKNLRENSKKEGITIYGDWDGNMAEDYNMAENDSNLIVIDDKGIIRFMSSGIIPKSDFEKIKSILTGK